MARVGFHNIGKNLTQGLIVMSIDDGTGLNDLDPAHDAVVVVLNGTATEKTHKVPTAQGFVLHSVQQNSADNLVSNSRFNAVGNDGEFVVPAYTAAVFVKPQLGAQGAGLKADATMGAPDIAPYGLTKVFVRGGMNGWGEVDAFSYVGDGVYSARVTVSAGTHEFKVASADWSTVDFGAKSGEQDLQFGVAQSLNRSGANLKATFNAGSYVFTLDARVPTAPVLTVSEYVPYGSTKVYLRGSLNGWSEANQFAYVGSNSYEVTLALAAGDYEFKVASADWSTVDFGAAAGEGVDVTLAVNKTLGRSGANLKIILAQAGNYKFRVDATEALAPVLNVTKLP